MQKTTPEPMEPSKQFCPNVACSARGKSGAGTIRIHDRKRERYRCTRCKQTFSARRGTMLEGLRKPTDLIVIVVIWMAGVVSARRDRDLADRLLQQVRACCQARRSLLICTDGWAAYPKSILRAFRDKVKKTAGKGRACLEIWPDLCIATVIKRTEKKRVVEVNTQAEVGNT